jgi:hypothetical protein
MERYRLRAVASFAARSTEWLLLALLLAVSIPPVLVRDRALTSVPTLNLIDGSWLLDTSYKASTGLWFGRDVAFTYGPLYQWLSSSPSRWIGLSIGSVFATWYTLPFLTIILATFASARLLMPDAAPWRRALFMLLAVVFWSPPDVRISVVLLAFTIFLRLTQKAAALNGAILLPGIASAAICVTTFLLSADTGLYTVAALLLCVLGTLIAQRRAVRLAKFLALTIACGAGFVVLVNACMFSPLNFQFWKSSLIIASAYRWFEPFAMTKADKRLLLETLALGVVVFGVAWWFRKSRGTWTRRPAFLIAGFGLGFLALQTSLVRSDNGHVLIGIYPLLFFCGAMALNEDEYAVPQWLSLAMPGAVVIATLALAHPFSSFTSASMANRWRQILHPPTSCEPGSQEFDRACFPDSDAEVLSTVSTYIGLNSKPGEPIALFPYQTAFGLSSRHPIAGGVLQSYLVNGDYLTRLEVAGLEKSSPGFGLYLPERSLSFGVDYVPNFTRSPGVWFYLLRHYRAVSSPVPAFVGLMRDDSREARLSFSEQPVGNPAGPLRVTRRSSVLDFGQIRWPSEGADFLRLRLRLNYPFWWRVRKPSKLTLRIFLADGTEKSLEFVVEPNRSNDVWIYPWDDRQMGSYFSADEFDWRPFNQPAVVGIRLFVTPFDWISVVPETVSVEQVEGVRLGLKSVGMP